MKRTFAIVMTVALMLSVLGAAGCASQTKIKNEWSKNAIEYYRNGIKNGFANEERSLSVSPYLKDKSKQFGYLLRDLDGDGVDELLIGIIDNGIDTKFTSVVVRHSNFGAYCLLSAGNGNYIYLCSQNVIRMDSARGSATETIYMKWNSRSNSFPHVPDGEGKYLPMKWELTAF